jgi:hypothetical protein
MILNTVSLPSCNNNRTYKLWWHTLLIPRVNRVKTQKLLNVSATHSVRDIDTTVCPVTSAEYSKILFLGSVKISICRINGSHPQRLRSSEYLDSRSFEHTIKAYWTKLLRSSDWRVFKITIFYSGELFWLVRRQNMKHYLEHKGHSSV